MSKKIIPILIAVFMLFCCKNALTVKAATVHEFTDQASLISELEKASDGDTFRYSGKVKIPDISVDASIAPNVKHINLNPEMFLEEDGECGLTTIAGGILSFPGREVSILNVEDWPVNIDNLVADVVTIVGKESCGAAYDGKSIKAATINISNIYLCLTSAEGNMNLKNSSIEQSLSCKGSIKMDTDCDVSSTAKLSATGGITGRLKLEKYSYTFAYNSNWIEYGFEAHLDSENIAKAVSSNTSVAKVSYCSERRFDVAPVGPGSCTITVTGTDGCTVTVKITVTEAYIKRRLKDSINLDNDWNGSNKIKISGKKGTSGKLVYKKKTYKFSLGSSKKTTVKLKTALLLNEKIKITAKNGNCSVTFNSKVWAFNYTDTIKGSGKSLKVEVFNLHKGDTVKVKHKGKTYKKKVKKDYDKKFTTLKFKTKKKVGKSDKVTVTILNKKNKKLDSSSYKLEKGKYDFADDIT